MNSIVNKRKIVLSNTQATLNLGKNLALVCKNAINIYLYGNLGTGKTTFSRGFLKGLGYSGNIKSPTYSLITTYNINKFKVCHFDFYRLKNSKELEFIGIDDYFDNNAICLVEWPKKGLGILPNPDIKIFMKYHNKGRIVFVQASSFLGNFLVSKLLIN